MGLKLLVCMECNFFGNIVNSVNFQDAGICPVRKTALKTSSSAIKYSSGAAFNNSAVRPQSSDALLNFNRLIACIRSARVHVGFWIQYRWQTWWLCKWSNKQCFQHGGKFIHRWLLYTTSSRWSRQSFSQRFPTWKGFMPQCTVWRALETMLFLWLVAVQTWLYSVQYHVSKNFVEQSYGCNRPKVCDQCCFSMFRQHREQSPSPARRNIATWKQIII